MRLKLEVLITCFTVCCLLSCCGEEEKEIALSDSIIGSWQCGRDPFEGGPAAGHGLVTMEGDWTLTFYTGGFDSLITISVIVPDEGTMTIKSLMSGRYEAFQDTVVLRALQSDLMVDPAELKPLFVESLGGDLNAMESKLNGTFTASVDGDLLLLNQRHWMRL